MYKIHLKPDNRELHERLESSIKEQWAKRNDIEEIQLNPDKYSLLISSSPSRLLEYTTDREENRVLLFMGIPLIRDFGIDKDVDWKLKLNKT